MQTYIKTVQNNASLVCLQENYVTKHYYYNFIVLFLAVKEGVIKTLSPSEILRRTGILRSWDME